MPNVSGRITVHGDKPANNATVELHNSTGDHISQMVVDEDGAYRFHLAPGSWRLNVYDAHGHRGKADFELGNDDEKLDLDLEEPEGGH
jgi:hypothetical protein